MTLIPTIIEQSARSERAYDLISCLLKERIILLTAPIDDTVSGNLPSFYIWPPAQVRIFSCISIPPAAASAPVWRFMIRCA